MPKTSQDYLGNNFSVENGFINLYIDDLLEMANINHEINLDPTDANSITALIIVALFAGALPEKDDDNFDIIDKTQAIVSDSRSLRTSIITREDEKQLQNKYTFQIYLKDSTEFDPIKVIGSTSTHEIIDIDPNLGF